MRAGRLKHRVEILHRVGGLDDAGQEIEGDEGWEVWQGGVPAFVNPVRGVEGVQAGVLVQGVSDYEITLRYIPGIVQTMRVRWHETYDSPAIVHEFDIVGAPQIFAARREIKLSCKERDSHGWRG